MTTKKQITGLYSPAFEKDSCGFGLIAQMDGKPSHWLLNTAIAALARLTHRGAVAADGKTGDGCGLLLSLPDEFFRAVAAENKWQLAKNFAVRQSGVYQSPGISTAFCRRLARRSH